MFFDGTANNTYSAQWGKQQLENYYRKWKAKYDAECEINSKTVMEQKRSSNYGTF